MILPQAPPVRVGAGPADARRPTTTTAVLALTSAAAPGIPLGAATTGGTAAVAPRRLSGSLAPTAPWRAGQTRGLPRGVIARLFREAADREGFALNEAAAAAAASAAAAAAAAVAGGRAGRTADAVTPPPPLPSAQDSTAAFTPSTRQHHAAVSHRGNGQSAHSGHNGEGGQGRRRQGRRADKEGEMLAHEAEARAVGAHPDILIEDLADEATVPYDAAGSLDSGISRGAGGSEAAPSYDDAGNAYGPPSAGAGPHAGLAVEDLDSESGGYTTSLPAVDPAYDDVGRAIRAETGASRRAPRPSLLDAEAMARKVATAEDLRESTLDQLPELQDVYGVYGSASARGRADMGGAEVGDERLEELLERGTVGVDGAVLTDAAEAVSEPDDPLSAPVDAGPQGAGDPLAPLDKLAHLEALEQLRGGVAADIADVMPSPPPRGAAATAAAAAAAAAAATSSVPLPGASGAGSTSTGTSTGRSSGGSTPGRSPSGARWPIRLGVGGLGAGLGRARPSRPGPPPPDSRVAGHPPHVHGSVPTAPLTPPFYHTSPDVPDEDLEGPRTRLLSSHRRRLRRRRPQPEPALAPAGAAPATASSAGPAGGAAGGARAGGYDVLKSPVYGNSPDVPDEELERTGGDRTVACDVTAAVPVETAPLPPASTPAGPATDPAPVPAPQGAAVTLPPPPQQQQEQEQRQAPPRPPSSPASARDSRRLKSLSDVDRQFIDLDAVGGWDEQAHDLRMAMRRATPRPGSAQQPSQANGGRGASSSLQTQTIGIHGGGAATAFSGGGSGYGFAASDSRPFTVLRVESVPSQTYGAARTAAVLAADGQLTLLARPTGPSPERVRAAIRLLRMAPGTRDFHDSAAAAEAAADANDERAAAAEEAAVVAAVAAAAAASGTPGMELEALERQAAAAAAAAEAVGAAEGEMSVSVTPATIPSSSPLVTTVGSPAGSPMPSLDERELIEFQPGLILGASEINPGDVPAEPAFPLDDTWGDHHDPHDPHGAAPMSDGEGHMLGLQANMWHEDYDEVMGQIADSQRSGWAEDGVNGGFDSDVY